MVSSPRSYGQGREALLEATIDVVGKRGLRGLTFRAVAEVAGVNNALVSHHFGNREGLLIAALEWSTQRAIDRTALATAAERPGEYERTLGFRATENRNLLVFQYELILESSRNPRFREPVTELYRAYFRASMPHAATKADAQARARFATIDGLVLQMVSGAITSEEFTESIHEAAEWLWPGVAVGRPAT